MVEQQRQNTPQQSGLQYRAERPQKTLRFESNGDLFEVALLFEDPAGQILNTVVEYEVGPNIRLNGNHCFMFLDADADARAAIAERLGSAIDQQRRKAELAFALADRLRQCPGVTVLLSFDFKKGDVRVCASVNGVQDLPVQL